MTLDKLLEEYTTIQQQDESILKEANYVLDNLNKQAADLHDILDETKRVKNVAHFSKEIIDNIEQEFEKKTSITNTLDLSFLGVAIALQCLRYFLLNKLTERTPEGQSKFEDWAHKAQDKILKNDKKQNTEIINNFGNKINLKKVSSFESFSYYASFERIVTTYSVPYDAIYGTKIFEVGGIGKGVSGDNHRFKTIGHDPLWGFIFGTANILTSTLTNWQFQTFAVNKSNTVVGNASTLVMFQKTVERSINDPKSLGAAVIKQALHIASDMYTTNGIPLPNISKLSPDLANQLGKYGVDTGGLIKGLSSFKIAEFIDSLIASIHLLYWDESVCTLDQYKVRTKKILSISKCIAEGSNIIATAISGDILNFDIGGILFTVYRVINDINFMTEIKKEYIADEFGKIIMGNSI